MEYTAMPRRKTDPNRSVTDEYLLGLLENIEEEWRSMKRNKLSEEQRSSCTAVIVRSFDFFDGSPRSLMSSLQSTQSSPESGYKLTGRRLFENDDDESEGRSEISYGTVTISRDKGLTGRKLFDDDDESEGRSEISDGTITITRDKGLTGGRLFDDDDDESEGGSEISDGTVTRDKGLNLSVSSGSCSCCSVSVSGPVVHEAESVWRKWRGFMGLIMIAAAVFVLVGLGFEGFVDEQVMLVPT